MSYRENLLTQKEPLEQHEISDLKEWLETLEGDVEMFGPTAEDETRIAAIKARIAKEEGQ